MSSLEPYGILVSKWNEEIKALEILKKGIYKMRLSEEEINNDLISRSALKKEIETWYKGIDTEMEHDIMVCSFIAEIDAQPPCTMMRNPT